MSGDIENIVGDFKPEDNAGETGFQPIPKQWLPMQIEKCEIKETKARTGKYLKLQFCIIGDAFAGRKLFKNINLSNPNPTCVEIGRRELANLGLALGLTSIKDTTDLIDKIVMGEVVIKQEQGRDPENEIKQYRPVNGTAAPAPAAAPAAAPKPAAAPAAKQAKAPAQIPPWMKN